jgi:hypothetical protein
MVMLCIPFSLIGSFGLLYLTTGTLSIDFVNWIFNAGRHSGKHRYSVCRHHEPIPGDYGCVDSAYYGRGVPVCAPHPDDYPYDNPLHDPYVAWIGSGSEMMQGDGHHDHRRPDRIHAAYPVFTAEFLPDHR